MQCQLKPHRRDRKKNYHKICIFIWGLYYIETYSLQACILWDLYHDVILKFIRKHKGPRTAKAIPSRKKLLEAIHTTIPDFKLHFRVVEIQTVRYWHTNRFLVQWNKIEDPNMSTCNCSHLVFDRDDKNTSSTSCMPTWRRKKLDTYHATQTQLQIHQRSQCEIWSSWKWKKKTLVVYTTWCRCRKELSNRLSLPTNCGQQLPTELHRTKDTSLHVKKKTNEVKKSIYCERIFSGYTCNGIISRMHKELKKSKNQGSKWHIKNGLWIWTEISQ